MYARVINGLVRPDKMDELIDLVNNTLAPAASRQPGSRGLMLLTDVGTGRALSISLWESKEAMRDGETGRFLEGQLEQVLPLLREAPSTHSFLVSSGG